MRWIAQTEEDKARQEVERTEKWEHYIARLIYEVVSPRLKNPNSMSHKDFLIKFKFDSSSPVDKEHTEKSYEQRKLEYSKMARTRWSGLLAGHGVTLTTKENKDAS